MNICKCGSYAINIDPDEKVCDKCYWKNKYETVLSQKKILIQHIKIIGSLYADEYMTVRNALDYVNSL